MRGPADRAAGQQAREHREGASRAGEAFAPGHVTGFFQIWDADPNVYRRGSVGAGFSVALGVEARAVVADGPGPLSMRVDGTREDLPVVAAALRHLVPPADAGDSGPAWGSRPRIGLILSGSLPSGQGFGVSAAGTLAASLAVARALGIPAQRAHWEAHRAEVEQRTGLGDVAAAWAGGFEMRVTPGVQPLGVVENFATREALATEVVLCAAGPKLSTASVLSDPEKRRRVNEAGGESLARLRAEPTVARFVEESNRFAEHLAIASPRLAEALGVASAFGPAGQSMLGDSLFLLLPKGDQRVEQAVSALEPFGWTARTAIADRGASGLLLRPPAGAGGFRPQRGPREAEGQQR